jgi:hypothetical protein
MLSTEHMCGGSLIIVSFLYLGDVGHDGPEREDVVVEPAAPPPLGLQVLRLEPRCRRRLPLTPVPAAEVEHRRDEVLRLHLLAAARPLPPRHCGRTAHHSRQAGGGADGRSPPACQSLLLFPLTQHALARLRVAYYMDGCLPLRNTKGRRSMPWTQVRWPLVPGGSWLLLLAPVGYAVAWTPSHSPRLASGN